MSTTTCRGLLSTKYLMPHRGLALNLHNVFFVGSFGEVGPQTEQYVEWLRDYCQAFFYGLSVKLLPPVTVPETGCSFRVNSRWQQNKS